MQADCITIQLVSSIVTQGSNKSLQEKSDQRCSQQTYHRPSLTDRSRKVSVQHCSLTANEWERGRFCYKSDRSLNTMMLFHFLLRVGG